VFTARYELNIYVICVKLMSISLVFHRGSPGSIPDQYMWNLWWMECHCGRIFFESVSVFPFSGPFYHCSILIVIEGIMGEAWEPPNKNDPFW
jgi:hypothetical protein